MRRSAESAPSWLRAARSRRAGPLAAAVLAAALLAACGGPKTDTGSGAGSGAGESGDR